MRAWILATGDGDRSAGSRRGSFRRIGGLTLLERTIATAMRAGVGDFVVLTAAPSPAVELLVADVARRRGVPVRLAAVAGGAGDLAGDQPFLLLHGDQVFDEAIVRRLLDRGLRGDACVIAVDRTRPPWMDARAGVAVAVQGDRVVDTAAAPDARPPAARRYDTGIMLCAPELAGAIGRALADDATAAPGALARVVDEVAARGGAAVIEVDGAFWTRVATDDEARRAEALLRTPSGKSRDGWVSRRLNRPLSRAILTPMLMRLYPGITANQVSALSFLVGVAAAIAFAAGQPLPGAVALHLASVLDGSDGEIARLKRLESPFGQFFDSMLDRCADSLVLVAMLAFAWSAAANRELLGDALTPIALTVGALAVSGHWLVSYTTARAALDLGHRYEGHWIAGGRGRDLRLLILAVAGVVAVLHPVAVLVGLAVIAVLTNSIVLRRVALSRAVVRGDAALADVNAVIYDLDGTLLDSMPALTTEAVALITGSYAIDAPTARERYLASAGADFATQLEELFPAEPRNVSVAAEFERRKEELVPAARLFDDVPAVVQFLAARGQRQFVCSSTREELVDATLRRTGLAGHLDGWTGFVPGRTKDEQIRRLVLQHGLDPARTLFVGDRPRDAMYAARGGVRFHGLAREGGRGDFDRLGVPVAVDLDGVARAWARAVRLRASVVDEPAAPAALTPPVAVSPPADEVDGHPVDDVQTTA